MKEIDTKKWDNIFFLKIFLGGVGILIVISIFIRIIFLLVTSSFNSSTFTMLVVGEDANIIKVDKNIGELDSLIIHNARSNLIKNSRLVNSIIVGVPIEGEIVQNQHDLYNHISSDYFSLGSMANIFLHQTQYSFIDMNLFDVFKMDFASQGISNTNINQQTVSSISPTDPLLFNYFKNDEILNEKMSVEVVNATNTQGLASRVAQMLENGGYNVVSIISADDTQHSKIIYRISPNDSLHHLVHLFSVPTQYKKESYIADVSIILGEDIASKVPQE